MGSRPASPACRSACCAGPASTRRWMPKASPRWSAPRRCWRMPAPRWTRPIRTCPTRAAIFAGVWGAALSRLVATTPEQLRGLLDPGIHEVARALSGMSAIQYLDGEAMRAAAGHAMARLHQTLRPGAVPDGAGRAAAGRRADRPTRCEALCTHWAPWTFTFNLTRQPAIAVPMGLRANGMPRSVQTRRGAVSRRPGAARGAGAGAGGAVPVADLVVTPDETSPGAARGRGRDARAARVRVIGSARSIQRLRADPITLTLVRFAPSTSPAGGGKGEAAALLRLGHRRRGVRHHGRRRQRAHRVLPAVSADPDRVRLGPRRDGWGLLVRVPGLGSAQPGAGPA